MPTRRDAHKKTASKLAPIGGDLRSQASPDGAEGKRSVRKTAPKKPAVTKAVAQSAAAKTPVAGKRTVKKAVTKKAATQILSAAKGARTLTHRKIKQAVARVFKERYGTDA